MVLVVLYPKCILENILSLFCTVVVVINSYRNHLQQIKVNNVSKFYQRKKKSIQRFSPFSLIQTVGLLYLSLMQLRTFRKPSGTEWSMPRSKVGPEQSLTKHWLYAPKNFGKNYIEKSSQNFFQTSKFTKRNFQLEFFKNRLQPHKSQGRSCLDLPV